MKKPAKKSIKTNKSKRTTKPLPAVVSVSATVLVLRLCNADMSSSHRFTWPEIGPVECPDWQDNTECGHGLHGWLWGEGDHSVATWTGDNKWLVVEVLASDIRDLGGKVKFPRGEVVFCGDQPGATGFLRANLPPEKRDAKIIGGTATAGYRGTATAGDRGTATAGYRGTATAGDRGTATAGDSGSIVLNHYDGTRWLILVGVVGQNGIEKGKPYHTLDGKTITAGEHPSAKGDREYAAKVSAMKPVDRP